MSETLIALLFGMLCTAAGVVAGYLIGKTQGYIDGVEYCQKEINKVGFWWK